MKLYLFSLKNTAMVDKQNGQSTVSSSHTHSEDRVPARTSKDTNVHPGSVQKSASDCSYTRRKLRLTLKTYQRTKANSVEPSVYKIPHSSIVILP